MFLDLVDSWISSWTIGNWSIVFFILFLAVGTFFLVKFCDLFVDSASSIAKMAHVSPLVIGLTIVAMGTSCPELAVSASDSISALVDSIGKGPLEQVHANIAMGNVVGSNICNILLVLGFSCVFTPIVVRKAVLKRDYPFLIGASLLFVLFGLFFGISSVTGDYAIMRFEGIIFVVLMAAYLIYLVWDAKKHPSDEMADSEEEIKEMPIWKAILFLVIGVIGIALGGELVVVGAKNIALKGAEAINIEPDLAEKIVGLTVVAVGTSLPELVTSVIAAKKGQVDMALGNVIGSNLFNILFVLGISATINPIIADKTIVFDLVFMMTITLLLFGLSFTRKLDKKVGFLFLGLYVLYISYLVLRVVLASNGITWLP